MEELNKSRGLRKVHTRHLKNLENEITEACLSSEGDCDERIVNLTGLKMSFLSNIDKIRQKDDEVQKHLKGNDLEDDLELCLKRDDNYNKCIAKIDLHIKNMKLQNSEIQHSHISSTGKTDLNKIRLPKIELPKFNGDIIEWKGFWDQFESTVHNNKAINEIEKFNYLRSLLEENAYSAISGLTLSSENYKQAVEILKTRYNNEQVLISAYMQKFVKIPKVKNIHDIQGLRFLCDSVETSIRNLNSLRVETSSYGTLLVPLLNEKLPGELRITIARNFENSVWDLNEMIKILKTEINAKELSVCVGTSNSIETNKDNFSFENKNFTTSALYVSNKNNYKRKSCDFCNLKNHVTSRCLKVTEPGARKRILRQKGLCFVCFSNEHLANSCESNYICRKCNGRHHISICTFDKINHSSNKETFTESTHNNLTSNKNSILLQTANADVSDFSENYKSNTLILFDSGSQRTYISKELREKLKLPTLRKEKVLIKAFGKTEFDAQTVDIVAVKVRKGAIERHIEAICMSAICSELMNQNVSYVSNKYPHFKDLELADSSENSVKNVQMLIGLDYYYAFISHEIIKGKMNEPIAVKSILGWILCGYYEYANESATNLTVTHMYRVKLNNNEIIEETVKTQTKNFLSDEFSISGSIHDDLTFKKFEESLRFNEVNKRYVVKLPFKEENKFLLPDNYYVAKNRLMNLKQRLEKNSTLAAEYSNIFNDYLNNGIIEKVEDNNHEESNVHYLPHRPVIKHDRDTTKVRIVFDASSKSKDELCLNDVLFSGPCLLPHLYDILLRFRIGKIGIVSDIKQAFLQVFVDQENRNFLRFLWLKNIHDPNSEIITYRFTRVVFGLTSSPFLLNATLKNHLSNFLSNGDKFYVEKLMENLYVDDLTNTFDTIQECIEFYKISKSSLIKANFTLRKWATNDVELKEFIAKEENLTQHTTNDAHTDYRKVLGINWDLSKDEFVFEFMDIIKIAESLPITKRTVVKIGGMFFDPLGLLCPLTLKPKLLFKEICLKKFSWDSVIQDSDLVTMWQSFLRDLTCLDHLVVKRRVLCCNRKVQIHGFCDSAGKAYSACVYLRSVCIHGVRVRLLTSKNHLVPSTPLSIPRLELLSCVLLSKLIVSVRQALMKDVTIEGVWLWSDSMVALWWLKQTKRQWKVWVQNRVETVRDNVDVNRWFHVSTNLNPADISTRFKSLKSFGSNKLWWEGPSFLQNDENEWSILEVGSSKEAENEEKDGSHSLMVDSNRNMGIGEIIDCERYSSLGRLLRVTCYVLRFVSNLKVKIRQIGQIKEDEVDAEEMGNSKRLWLKYEQLFIKNSDSYLKVKNSLNLFEDEDGLLRCKTRFSEHPTLNYNAIYPILLQTKSYFTTLIIMDYHKQNFHNGVTSTLHLIRQYYWIVTGRQVVKTVLRKCFVCKYFQRNPVRPSNMAALPSYRLSSEHAFQHIGLDFLGPLYFKSKDNGMKKCYILLFTCCVVRAIHLELTVDVSSDSVILALRRFIARRGVPELAVSDNFKSFKSAVIKKYLANKEIKWSFILERSPWWGGFYERLVALVKNSLKKSIMTAKLTYDEISTIIIEIENVINSRPLTYLDNENIDIITPYHLIFGRNLTRNINKKSTMELNRQECERILGDTKINLDYFMARFEKEYLTSLQEKHSYIKQIKDNRVNDILHIGDIVLIKENMKSRLMWKKGKIKSFIRGRDDVIRGVELIIYQTNLKRTIIVKRPIQLVVPLELTDNRNYDNKNDNITHDKDMRVKNNTERRSQRISAANADIIRKLMT